MAKAKPLEERAAMSLVDACIELAISHQTGQRLLHKGILKGFRTGRRGGRWMVFKDTVEEAKRLQQHDAQATH